MIITQVLYKKKQATCHTATLANIIVYQYPQLRYYIVHRSSALPSQ